ncbi:MULTISPECIES: 30S ribosomal protein S3 [Caldilinea]|uniref:Small ribosomal subunit protein uS3 n=2 Tax=Caldilinea aerophila TaxID=133453 RepID=I0HZK6_CALAS|nr:MULTISPECIES: 30S ribosomal protein S3 [Caldilinea]MBO9393181.1 30S ribosomal protein S3 [Caldilinea sp.]BAL98443.1 30S ribosomal protein S3 [Caldilinea aerophila DSM 14535 = NBRC 104270]GIV74974.1 MAG: 30S ribosomal protein S3 [Caldilinea sp.]
MGRKVHPIGFRLGIIKEHKSRWFATGRQYTDQVTEDRQIRALVYETLNKEERGGRESRQATKNKAGISNIDIERQPNQVHIIIDTARPGVIIGRKGASVNQLRQQLQELTQKKVKIDVREITKPELDARLVAESIAEQIERRVSWKRAMKQAAQKTMRAGAQGIMITVSGRLGGSDMGRVDSLREGRIPRHTLRADIDYGTAEANTTFGVIGVKVWIYLGEVMPGQEYHAKYLATES